VTGGAAIAALGALVVLAGDGLNANGGAGPAPVVLGLAVLSAGLAAGGERVPPALRVAGGLAVALVALTMLDLVPVIRYSADLAPFGGLVAVSGRVIAAIGALVVLVAVAAGIRRVRKVLEAPGSPDGPAADTAPKRRRPTPARTLATFGAGMILVAWAVLLAVGEGFALRLIDGLGLAAAILAAAVASSATGDRLVPATFVRPVLAAVALLSVLDGLVAVVPYAGDLAASGPASVASFGVYLAVAVPLIGVLVLDLRGPFRRIRTSPPQASPPTTPPPPPETPPVSPPPAPDTSTA
jgi:hypothetical protein